MMKLTFIGVGSAFTMENYQSNMLLEVDPFPGLDSGVTKPFKLLIDAGGDARHALRDAGLARKKKELLASMKESNLFASLTGLSEKTKEKILFAILAEKYPEAVYTAKDIDGLYVSHCHADHIGGIEWLGFYRYFSPGTKPELFIPERLAGILWNDSLRGGMASHQGVLLELDSFFDRVTRIKKNETFRIGEAYLRPVQTVHYMDGYEIVPSYGLLISPNATKEAAEQFAGKEVHPFEAFLTTDTQFAPEQIKDFYKRAQIIFQDCETYTWKSEKPIKSGVHAHYSDLKTLPAEIKAKMWLYHYQDGDLPDAKADGFAGFIKNGQSFVFNDKYKWVTE